VIKLSLELREGAAGRSITTGPTGLPSPGKCGVSRGYVAMFHRNATQWQPIESSKPKP
jgi:hypothetical protein